MCGPEVHGESVLPGDPPSPGAGWSLTCASRVGVHHGHSQDSFRHSEWPWLNLYHGNNHHPLFFFKVLKYHSFGCYLMPFFEYIKKQEN